MSDNKEECDMNLRHQDLEKPESQEKLIEIMNRVDNKFGIFAVHGILPKESGVTEETILNSPETMKVIEAVQPSMIADRKKVIYEESDEEILAKYRAIIKKEKEERGLLINFSKNPPIEVAREFVAMHQGYLDGDYIDITDKRL